MSDFIFHDGPGSVQPQAPDTSKLIDKGPFFDRFLDQKMPVLISSDATIKAVIADINNRHWIDLSLPEVAQTLTYIGSVIPGVTVELQDAILNTPVGPMENLALRKLYFS